MPNNCEVINSFGTFEFESQLYGALSLASRLAAYTKNRANTLKIAYSLRAITRDLSSFLDDVYAILEGKKTVPKDNNEPLEPRRLFMVAENIDHLYRTIDSFYEAARRANLTNNSLTSGNLASLKRRNEELRDLADWIETVAQPKDVKAVFDRAEREKESGELYDLDQVL